MDLSTNRKKERALAGKPKALRNQILGSLGASILITFFILLGCGSDSKPAKNEKAAASAVANKTQSVARLVLGNNQTAREEGGKAKKEPASRFIEIFPGVTKEDIDAEARVARKEFDKPTTEIFPGITRKEVDARLEASRKEPPPDMEIFPGITRKEVEARLAAERQKPENKVREIIPGVTLEEVNAKRGQQQGSPDMKKEIFAPSAGK